MRGEPDRELAERKWHRVGLVVTLVSAGILRKKAQAPEN
jgi:hypothetical protein